MIKVICRVNSIDDNVEKQLLVKSNDEQRDAVVLVLDVPVNENGLPSSISVNATDLIQAVENCRNNCFRKYLPYNRVIQNTMEEGI